MLFCDDAAAAAIYNFRLFLVGFACFCFICAFPCLFYSSVSYAIINFDAFGLSFSVRLLLLLLLLFCFFSPLLLRLCHRGRHNCCCSHNFCVIFICRYSLSGLTKPLTQFLLSIVNGAMNHLVAAAVVVVIVIILLFVATAAYYFCFVFFCLVIVLNLTLNFGFNCILRVCVGENSHAEALIMAETRLICLISCDFSPL